MNAPVILCLCCYTFLFLIEVKSIHSSSRRQRLEKALDLQYIIPVLHNLLPDEAKQYASFFREAKVMFTTSLRHDLALDTVNELSGFCDNEHRLVKGNNDDFIFGVSTMHDASQVCMIHCFLLLSYSFAISFHVSSKHHFYYCCV